MALKTVWLASALLAGAAAASILAAPLTAAEPGCVNPDGSPCSFGTAGPNGASGSIPGGPGGTAGPGGVSGGIPGGPSGSAWPGGASGCIPGLGCYSVGR